MRRYLELLNTGSGRVDRDLAVEMIIPGTIGLLPGGAKKTQHMQCERVVHAGALLPGSFLFGIPNPLDLENKQNPSRLHPIPTF